MPGRFHKRCQHWRLLQDTNGQDDVVGGRSHVQGIQQERAPVSDEQLNKTERHQRLDFSKLW